MKHLQTTDFYKMKIPTNHPHPYRNGKVGGVHQMKVTTFFRVNLLKTIRQYRVVSSVFFLFFLYCFFFNYLRNAPDASVAMGDDERNTFYHYHGCVEAQSLRLVNAYLADKGIDGHQ